MEIHSFISPCKNIIFKIKPLKKKPNILHNSRTNLKFQHKPKFIHPKHTTVTLIFSCKTYVKGGK
jgi:hypothetical protein